MTSRLVAEGWGDVKPPLDPAGGRTYIRAMSNSVTPPLCDWGTPFFDEQKIPALRYAPPAIPAAEAPFVTGFVAGNRLVKLLASGDGSVFPCLLNGPVQLLCGDPGDRAFSGAGRLFVSEAGRVKEVVGPEHRLADHSSVETAGLVLAPSYVEKEFVDVNPIQQL